MLSDTLRWYFSVGGASAPSYTRSEVELKPFAKQSGSAKSTDSAPTKCNKGKKTEVVKVEPESTVEEQGTGEATALLKDEALTLSKGKGKEVAEVTNLYLPVGQLASLSKDKPMSTHTLQLEVCLPHSDGIYVMSVRPDVIVGAAKWNALDVMDRHHYACPVL
ncbi:hypothetical protein EVJ58_g7735 [Rhodofomes roseus]|uniref:Uncharacterized protein n=1 Tax=Rhodofomes roseus TaxID=34475 RepID=A0A4Y9Y4C5_9APHY|nr:hypothetical protein EVJ58_g7735 [Rhodofomes roseus]